MALEFLPLPAEIADHAPQRVAPVEEPAGSPFILTGDDSTGAPNVRLLTPNEVLSLDAEFKQRGCCLPDPASSFFVGAVEDGKVVGYLVIQSVTHAEPMRIAEGHQHLVSRIVHTAEQIISERITEPMNVFLMAEPGRVAELAERLGMKAEPWMVLSKRVEPQMDAETAAMAAMTGELIQ